ncbi:hypothetical protein pb186bvf_007990 [Paramecium bursaria]
MDLLPLKNLEIYICYQVHYPQSNYVIKIQTSNLIKFIQTSKLFPQSYHMIVFTIMILIVVFLKSLLCHLRLINLSNLKAIRIKLLRDFYKFTKYYQFMFNFISFFTPIIQYICMNQL